MANETIQSAYYFLGTLGILVGAGIGIWRWHRGVVGKIYARISALEKEAVTVTAMRDALHELLQRFDDRWKAHTELLAARFARADERHNDLKDDLAELKAGQAKLADAISDLPCPPAGGAHGIA